MSGKMLAAVCDVERSAHRSGYIAAVLLMCFSACSLYSQDVVARKNGPDQPGKITGSDAQGVRIEVTVIPGQPTASMLVPYPQIKTVTFGDAPAVAEFLRTATSDKLPAVAALWAQRQNLLAVPGANAGEIGLTLGNLLLQSSQPSQHLSALALFEKIAATDVDAARKIRASESRLRALIAVGRAAEAVEDAKKLAATSENPATLIEAKFILAEASFKQFKKLLEDNPRWQEDVNIRPERNRLYHETLDLYLYPSLFYGAETEPAARGLWGAIQVCQLGDEFPAVREMARDLEVLYPETAFAVQAKTLIQSLPPDTQKPDYEKTN